MSCRRLFDPWALAALAVTTIATAGGLVAEGAAQEAQADAQAEDLKNQAQFEKVQAARAVRDEREEQRRRRSRIIALASARGNVGTGALGRSESESALRIQRIQSDARMRSRQFRAQASNVREMGDFARGQSIFQAGAELVGGGLSAGSKLPKGGGGGTTTPTTPAFRKASTGRLAGPV